MKFRVGSSSHLFALAVSLLLLCFPAQSLCLVKGQRAFSIPFEISSKGHIFLRARINGSEPLWFGLDSGTEQTLISQQQAKALKLKLQGGMQAAGSGEESV